MHEPAPAFFQRETVLASRQVDDRGIRHALFELAGHGEAKVLGAIGLSGIGNDPAIVAFDVPVILSAGQEGMLRGLQDFDFHVQGGGGYISQTYLDVQINHSNGGTSVKFIC